MGGGAGRPASPGNEDGREPGHSDSPLKRSALAAEEARSEPTWAAALTRVSTWLQTIDGTESDALEPPLGTDWEWEAAAAAAPAPPPLLPLPASPAEEQETGAPRRALCRPRQAIAEAIIASASPEMPARAQLYRTSSPSSSLLPLSAGVRTRPSSRAAEGDGCTRSRSGSPALGWDESEASDGGSNPAASQRSRSGRPRLRRVHKTAPPVLVPSSPQLELRPLGLPSPAPSLLSPSLPGPLHPMPGGAAPFFASLRSPNRPSSPLSEPHYPISALLPAAAAFPPSPNWSTVSADPPAARRGTSEGLRSGAARPLASLTTRPVSHDSFPVPSATLSNSAAPAALHVEPGAGMAHLFSVASLVPRDFSQRRRP